MSGLLGGASAGGTGGGGVVRVSSFRFDRLFLARISSCLRGWALILILWGRWSISLDHRW